MFRLMALVGVRVLWPQGLNSRYYLDLNRVSRQSAWAHGFMHAYALWLGLVLITLTFLAAYAVVWWRRDTHAAALMVLGGVGTLIALGLNQVVGHAARELRPYDTYTHALVLVGKANDYAFPSDHAVVAGALVMSLILVIRRAEPDTWWTGIGTRRVLGAAEPQGRGLTGAMVALTAVALVFGLFLCFARVYVGAHYPGDVVAGFLLGFAVVLAASAARPVGYWLAGLIERTPLAVLIRRPLPAWSGPAKSPGDEGSQAAS